MQEIEKSEYWDRYDPNWQEKWQIHHDAFHAYLDMDLDSLSNEQIKERREKLDFHTEGFQDAIISGYPNARAWAEHMIDSSSISNKRYIRYIPDLSNVKTLEDANAAWRAYQDAIDYQKNYSYYSLPVDQNHPLFKNELTKHWQTRVDYPYPDLIIGDIYSNIIVSVEKSENTTRVCLHDGYGNEGLRSAQQGYEMIATFLYHTQLKGNTQPESIEWYNHLDPSLGLDEKLIKVDMQFENGIFTNAQLDHNAYKTIPANFREIRNNLENEELHLSAECLAIPEKSKSTFSRFKNAVSDFFGGFSYKADNEKRFVP